MNAAGFRALLNEAMEVWNVGGWGMIALAVDSLVMFGTGTLVLVKLMAKGLFLSPERAWRRWREKSPRAIGILGRVIRQAMEGRTLAEIEHTFDAVKRDELLPFERDLRVMKVSIAAAPLLGLLGTVTGMLSTFGALAGGGGGDKTMEMIASGISEALITTETGLVLALSGLMYEYVLTRQHDRFGINVQHIETLCLQEFRRRSMGVDVVGWANGMT